jgi:G3E family GTPase
VLQEEQVDKLDTFLRNILWEESLPADKELPPFEIHRLKGRVPVESGKLLLIQGVRSVYEINDVEAAPTSNDRSKLVLIGRGLDQAMFRESLLATLA